MCFTTVLTCKCKTSHSSQWSSIDISFKFDVNFLLESQLNKYLKIIEMHKSMNINYLNTSNLIFYLYTSKRTYRQMAFGLKMWRLSSTSKNGS